MDVSTDAELEEMVGDSADGSTVVSPDINKVHFGPDLVGGEFELRGERSYKLPSFGIDELDRLALHWDLYLLHYCKAPTHTHKLHKAGYTLQWCANNDIGVALFGNFGDHRTGSSGINAFRYMQKYFPDIDVVELAPLREGENKPYIVVEDENPHTQNGRRRFIIRLKDRDDLGPVYLGPEKLEQIFQNCISGKIEDSDDPLNGLYSSDRAREMAEYFKNRNANCQAVTNLAEFAPPENEIYFYEGDTKRHMSEMDIIIGTVGTGERFRGQIMSVPPTYDENGKRIGPIHIAVTTSDNPLASYLKALSNKGSDRLSTPFKNPHHDLILQYALNPRYDIRFLVLDDRDKTQAAGLAVRLKSNIFPELEVGETGPLGLAALTYSNCISGRTPKHVLGQSDLTSEQMKLISQGGLIFNNLYSYKRGEDGQVIFERNPLAFQDNIRRQVCVVYTGMCCLYWK